ncbi:MAG: methylmalonyl Co-A mutase-associated GTPase MeaB, partial [Candidatus Rokubacteria bacterium]|nr:methylmalonyl Co-A mutase-associated GTPase MeaB [Candidatus Rokubacteria bacterium]
DVLELRRPGEDGWRPPVLATVAGTGKGVPEVFEAIGRHREHARGSGSFERRRRARARDRIRGLVEEALRNRVLRAGGGAMDRLVDGVVEGRTTPGEAARQLLRRVPLDGGKE